MSEKEGSSPITFNTKEQIQIWLDKQLDYFSKTYVDDLNKIMKRFRGRTR